jgi:hypothetical protein
MSRRRGAQWNAHASSSRGKSMSSRPSIGGALRPVSEAASESTIVSEKDCALKSSPSKSSVFLIAIAPVAQVDWDLQHQNLNQLTEFSMQNYHKNMKVLLDVIYQASKGLRVIDPHDKGADDAEIIEARRAIANAKRVFILGHGFDEHNSQRLNLREHLANTQSGYQLVAFTNYQDFNQINKRASKLFYDHPRNFPSGRSALSDRYEKSVRNTYEALAMDFDLAE